MHQTLKDISLGSDGLYTAVMLVPHAHCAHLRKAAMIALECVEKVVVAGVEFAATVVCISTVSLMTNAVLIEAFCPGLALESSWIRM